MLVSLCKFALFFGLLQSSNAIRCFICQSRSNPACQDPIKSYQLQLTECTPEVMHLSSRELGKALGGLGGLGAHLGSDLLAAPMGHSYNPMYCQKISFNVGDERVVVRGCQAGGGWAGAEPRAVCRVLEDQSRLVPGSYVNHCDTCDKDACNGSRQQGRPSSLLPILTALISSVVAVRVLH